MMMRIWTPTDSRRVVYSGTAFSHRGYFPAKWHDHASEADLRNWGITKSSNGGPRSASPPPQARQQQQGIIDQVNAAVAVATGWWSRRRGLTSNNRQFFDHVGGDGRPARADPLSAGRIVMRSHFSQQAICRQSAAARA
jgi:hypothetical protein